MKSGGVFVAFSFVWLVVFATVTITGRRVNLCASVLLLLGFLFSIPSIRGNAGRALVVVGRYKDLVQQAPDLHVPGKHRLRREGISPQQGRLRLQLWILLCVAVWLYAAVWHRGCTQLSVAELLVLRFPRWLIPIFVSLPGLRTTS